MTNKKPKSENKKKEVAIKKIGRPTLFNQDLVDTICERIANGESLRSICKDDDMPAMSVIFRWLSEDDKKGFQDQYARAREQQAETLADELLSIADDSTNDWMEKTDHEGNQIGWMFNKENVQRSRVRIDTRKWIASKLKPKKYGDFNRTEVTGENSDPVKIVYIDKEEKEAYEKHIYEVINGLENNEKS